ncbi:V-type proton ATPase subunit S1-like [Stylophora pistillata]|uniref:V-type proton ATPase subunit S1-like n=1 Tax=Stylophora pistillata TaxID=50429 RepID=UPI000C055489|nr:V-type proton ATPase subunit S1-like [Stylophora pistillata]
MAALSSLLLRSVFISFLGFLCAESSFPVPVFIWSKDGEVLSSSPVLAGHTVKQSDFQDKYLKKLFNTPQIICVYLQDRLSIDDLSHYGDAYSAENQGTAFSNLKVAMEAANSSAVLPSVDLSSSSGKNDELIQLIREMANGLVKEFNPEGKHGWVRMCLPMFSFIFSHFRLLPLIGAINGQISSTNLPYTCIMTVASPNEVIRERLLSEKRLQEESHDRFRRAADVETFGGVLEVSKDNSLINGSLFADAKCILLYFNGFEIQVNNTKYGVISNATDNLSFDVHGDCANTSDSITISFKGIEDFPTLHLSFAFTTNASEWKCIDATLTIDGTYGSQEFSGKFTYNTSGVLMAPSAFSYSCTNKGKSLFYVHRKPFCQTNISFYSLQVQPINVKNGTFSYAYDCTGFFTIPILMGLITAGVLLIILFIAVLAMFSLTTMDRFDDPKGPTIHVPTG